MFKDQDEKYLTRSLGRNEVVLFLGAGFSLGAENKKGEKFPTGWQLGKMIWDFLGHKESYDDTPLPILYQAFNNAGIKREQKTDFLNSNLLSGNIPDFYDNISTPYWYKIYTTNIDDVVQEVYKRNNKKLRQLIYPNDEFKERDQSLEETNIIHLHGKLPCNPENIVFSTKQYARAGLKEQPLYSQFVYDYATHPTIFLGTDLNEPLFERYIESREGREGFGELRPRSFLISPKISPVKAQVLKDEYNVHHIIGTTEDFLNWVKKIEQNLPEKNEILKRTFPSLLNILDYSDITKYASTKAIADFADGFKRVPLSYTVKNHRSDYLLGTNPTWNDIFGNLDIPRTISTEIYNQLYDYCTKDISHEKQKIISIIGTAGSGKSTILKRLGLNLSQNGVTVFITDSDYTPKINNIVEVLNAINEKVVLIFDNASNVLPVLNNLLSQISYVEKPPIIVLSIRNNQNDKLNFHIDPEIVDYTPFKIPHLDDVEIKALIAKLDKNNMLSKLKGMNDNQRFQEFKYRAKKQILVAMKEATNGKSFNDIIQDEFNEIQPYEAKVLCLCVALNTEVGFTNSKQDFIGFSEANHIETLDYLHNTLDGTISWVGDNFMIRHRILADYMIKHCASLNMLKTSYIRVLSVLAPELVNPQGYTRKFNLYKSLINHQILFQRFKNDIEMAREVYDSASNYLSHDAHFWLQYGSLEIAGTGGNLVLAENYINQAESLAPTYVYIQNAKCNLYYKLSSSLDDYSHAFEYKIMADDLSNELINNSNDPHITHIHCKGNYNFILKWVKNKDDKKEQLKKLKNIINNAVIKYPRDKKLDQASHAINRAYLILGTDEQNIIDPLIEE
jgi:energy-coupling factor transporter ATP-binding protein EcfA2